MLRVFLALVRRRHWKQREHMETVCCVGSVGVGLFSHSAMREVKCHWVCVHRERRKLWKSLTGSMWGGEVARVNGENWAPQSTQ